MISLAHNIAKKKFVIRLKIPTENNTKFNQEGVTVIEFRRTVMVYKRGHVPTRPR